MKPTNDGLRKAAILVASLDQRAADAVLDQLTPDQAQRVRRLVVDLDDVDPKEQERVIEEFFRVGPLVPQKQMPGIELDGSLSRQLFQGTDRWKKEDSGASPEDRPFRFLDEAEGEKLAHVLAGELPQTIALVLSHLPPERAGNVLAGLLPAVQADVVHRLVDLEETDPEILREVETALEARLAAQVPMQRRRTAGLQAVAGILDAAGRRVRVQILDNLAARDQALAERLGPAPIDFDDVAGLDDETLGRVFEEAGRELTVAALIGASEELARRVLRLLPSDEAQVLRERLQRPGPIRLRDVEEARRQIAQTAQRLAYRVNNRRGAVAA
jgi:flagellar motor switch protein FliG